MTLGVTDDSNYNNIADAIRDMTSGDTSELTYTPSEMGPAIRGLRSVWGNIEGTLSDQIDLNSALNAKQDTLTFDDSPTANSNNPVKSSGIKTALDTKQDTLTFDDSPTANSNNPVKSSGIKTALDTKQDTLIKSASGAIASFDDGVEAPAAHVVAKIEPVQEGEGDPSPDNVRPISGWTGVNITRTGKNLFSGVLKGYAIGSPDEGYRILYTAGNCLICKIESNKIYTITAKYKEGLNRFRIILFKHYPKPGKLYPNPLESKQLINDNDFIEDKVYTFNTNGDNQIYNYVFLGLSNENVAYDSTVQAQLEEGSTATAYEPYQGDTYSITFPSSVGTVYGGELDVTSGKLTVDRVATILNGSEYWRSQKLNSNKYKMMSDSLPSAGLTYGPSEIPAQLLSNSYIKKSRNDIYTNAENGINISEQTIHVYDENFSTSNSVDAWKTHLSSNPLQVVYKIATPITYQLTPTEITTLLGQNNIWSDTGDVDVSYWRDEAVGKSVPSAASVYKALIDIDNLGMKRYGVSGVGESVSTLTRIYDAVGMVAQVGTDGDNSVVRNDFDHALPFMRRKCVGEWTLEDGHAVFHVRAYYGDEGYTEDGSIGDYVAVECPRCYYLREGDKLVVSAHQYPGYRPFDIFCKNHNQQDTMPFVYLPAYALSLDENNHAVCLPGYDNEQGNYYDLVTRSRTYKNGELGGLAMIEPAAVNFYEYALATVEFATQNTETILKGCIALRQSNDDLCTFVAANQVLVRNWQAARVVDEYVAIVANNVDQNAVAYKPTHRITAIVRCDASQNPSSSGTYTLITLADLGKNYYTYDLTGATTYRFTSRAWRTGSCNSVSTPSGSPVSNTNGYYPMKYRWRENVWGNQWNTSMDLFDQRIGTGDDDYYLKWYYLNVPEEYTPSASSKPDATELASDKFTYLDVQTEHANYVNGYIKSKKFSELYPDIWIPYETTGASATTYFADYAFLVSSVVVRSVRFGGSWYAGSAAGPSSVLASNAPSHGYANFGAHLFIKQG